MQLLKIQVVVQLIYLIIIQSTYKWKSYNDPLLVLLDYKALH